MGQENQVNFKEMAETPVYQKEDKAYRLKDRPLDEEVVCLNVVAHQASVQLIFNTDAGQIKANPGDWVITNSNGEKLVCTDEEFKENYEEVSL